MKKNKLQFWVDKSRLVRRRELEMTEASSNIFLCRQELAFRFKDSVRQILKLSLPEIYNRH